MEPNPRSGLRAQLCWASECAGVLASSELKAGCPASGPPCTRQGLEPAHRPDPDCETEGAQHLHQVNRSLCLQVLQGNNSRVSGKTQGVWQAVQRRPEWKGARTRDSWDHGVSWDPFPQAEGDRARVPVARERAGVPERPAVSPGCGSRGSRPVPTSPHGQGSERIRFPTMALICRGHP